MVKQKLKEENTFSADALAHEIKNSLALIKATVDYLQLTDEASSHLKSYNVIKNEIKKAAAILQDIVSPQKSELDINERTSLASIISEVVSDYETALSGCITFSVQINVASHGDIVLCDKEALKVVFRNIIKNSIEAMDGFGEISISYTFNESTITAIIEDTGCGLSDYAVRMLKSGERFTTKENGSGIGVGVCKKIVEAHGGTYHIDTRAALGCVVIVSLPRVKV